MKASKSKLTAAVSAAVFPVVIRQRGAKAATPNPKA
jgi:hypothetical protein